MKKDIFLTVHDFALLHNVNKRTLHYYDQQGIFSPAKVGENGYRYYTYMQSAEFEIILALRELGMSIDEIRTYQKTRSTKSLIELITSQRKEIDEKIKNLRELKRLLSAKEKDLILSQSPAIDKIDIVTCPNEYLHLTDMSGFKSEEDLDETVFDCMADYQNHGKTVRAFNSGYGAMLPCENIFKGDFERYKYIFVKIPNPKIKKGLFLKPKGNYLRAFCKGEWNNLPGTYKKMIDYAKENNLRLTGCSYEEGINEMGIPSAKDMSDYVTKITILCESD